MTSRAGWRAAAATNTLGSWPSSADASGGLRRPTLTKLARTSPRSSCTVAAIWEACCANTAAPQDAGLAEPAWAEQCGDTTCGDLLGEGVQQFVAAVKPAKKKHISSATSWQVRSTGE